MNRTHAKPVRLTFPRQARLLKPAQFQAVFSKGRRYNQPLLVIHARVNDLGFARLGLAVSKRVSRKAVIRNRVKRHLRESFRQRQALLGGLDVVMVAKVPSALASHAEIDLAIESLLKKVQNTIAGTAVQP